MRIPEKAAALLLKIIAVTAAVPIAAAFCLMWAAIFIGSAALRFFLKIIPE